MEIWVAIVSGLLGTSGGLIAALVTQRFERQDLERELKFQEQKLQRELQAEHEALRTEYGLEQSVEAALRHYLQIAELPYRTFSMIRHHIGGFESNELRKHLVRSGAVRFMAADALFEDDDIFMLQTVQTAHASIRFFPNTY